jgi:hypothetical protein
MSFEDFEGEVVIDYDSNTFTVERNGKVHAYDIDREADWLKDIIDSGEVSVVEYEVYGQ